MSLAGRKIVIVGGMKADIYVRGAGYTFGAAIVKKFLTLNGMNHILRAHQLCMEGYSVLYDDQLSTVWSAPNYCYRSVQSTPH